MHRPELLPKLGKAGMATPVMAEQLAPIIDMLQPLESQEATGLLLCEKRDTHLKIYLEKGQIVATSSNLKGHRLGDYLRSAGKLGPLQLKELLAEQTSRRVHLGEILLKRRIVTSSGLSRLLHRQSSELLRAVRNGGDTEWRCRFEESGRSFRNSVPQSVRATLLETCRNNTDELEIRPQDSIALREKELSGYPWTPREVSVLTELMIPRSFLDLVCATGLQESPLRRILATLWELGLLQIKPAKHLEPLQGPPISVQDALESIIPVLDRPQFRQELEVVHNEHSFIDEQFKTLTVELLDIQHKRGVHVLNVTSASMEEGKSLVCSNLAFSLAKEESQRILLLDGDLRRPSVHSMLGIPIGPGLVDFFEDSSLKPHCYIRRVGNLYVLTAGKTCSNSIEQLSSKRMRDFLDYLRQHFNWILIDSPPLLPISDTQVLNGLVDGTLMVVRRGKTRYTKLEKARNRIVKEKVLGVVFNDVVPMAFNTYYDSNDYYYRGESEGLNQK